MNFDLLVNDAYLRIEQGLVFTYDGTTIIDGMRRSILSTRYLSRQRNLSAFGETRFWAWLLSDDGKTIRIDLGGPKLEIDAQPIAIRVHHGIFGDSKQIPENIESPPELFEPEEKEDAELIEDYEEEDEYT